MAEVLKALFKVIAGIILILLPIWAAVTYNGWGQATLDLIQGGIILGVIGMGLLVLIIGLTSFKE